MKKIIIISMVFLLIGIGLGYFVTGIQYNKDIGLREKMVKDQADIIEVQEERISQLQDKLNEQQGEIERVQTELIEQQKKIAQANTGINQREEKQTTDDKSLEKLLDVIGDARILSP